MVVKIKQGAFKQDVSEILVQVVITGGFTRYYYGNLYYYDENEPLTPKEEEVLQILLPNQ